MKPIVKIHEQLKIYQQKNLRLFTTCSFQTHSLALLHIISSFDKNIPVYFINTGFHFPESLSFRDEVSELLGIKIHNLFSPTPKNMQKDADGKLLFASDPDYCCYLNKTLPVEPLLKEHDVWINGVRADQSATRKAMHTEEPTPFRAIRFHPMLDWSPKEIHEYLQEKNLPRHPLEAKGYFSIGCEPCTSKIDLNVDERTGRWFGLKKTECGLNTDLVEQK